MTTASGSARLSVAQRRADRSGIALEGAFGGQLHVAFFQRALDAGQAVAAEGIVLVEDRDAPDVQILGQVLDPRLGLGARSWRGY